MYFCRNKCFYFSRAWLTVADFTVVLHGSSDWYNKNQNLLSSIQTVPWTKHSSIVTCLLWRFDPIVCRITHDKRTLLTPGDSILLSVGYRLTNGHSRYGHLYIEKHKRLLCEIFYWQKSQGSPNKTQECLVPM